MGKGMTRANIDRHIGHAGPFLPWHRTHYTGGSPDTFVNGQRAIRKGDKTECGDPATKGSASVFINGQPAHRTTDNTGGHDGWVPNASSEGSDNVFAGE